MVASSLGDLACQARQSAKTALGRCHVQWLAYEAFNGCGYCYSFPAENQQVRIVQSVKNHWFTLGLSNAQNQLTLSLPTLGYAGLYGPYPP